MISSSPKQQSYTPIRGVEWSEDGQFVYYWVQKGEDEHEWWAVDIKTGNRHQIDPLYPDVNEAVLALLRPNRGYLYAATLSPSGRRILYARTAEGCQEPATPSFLPTCRTELWTANADGSQPVSLGRVPVCFYHEFVGWFDEGRQALVSCDYEGLGDWRVIDLEQNTMEELAERTGFAANDIIPVGNVALSSNGRFAFGDCCGDKLSIISLLERGYLREVRMEGKKIGGPAWSSDGQWLYFLGSEDTSRASPKVSFIFRYSLEADRIEMVVDKQVISQLSWTTTDNQWELSPNGNKALFNRGDSLWMVSWENK